MKSLLKRTMFSVVLLLTLLWCGSALAAGQGIVSKGTCGENLTWSMDEEFTLTISGNGDMIDFRVGSYTGEAETPWNVGKVRRVIIEPGVTGIGKYAFYRCEKLESISIPDTVVEIRAYAFKDGRVLGELILPDGFKTIGENAFADCALKKVSLPESLTSIRFAAFHNCSHLKEITIPDGVTEIGGLAFPYRDITLYASANSDASEALSKAGFPFRVPGTTYDLKYLYDNDTLSGLELSYVDKDVTSFEIPEGITSIGNDAFQYNKNLTEVKIPDTVTSIGSFAFNQCTSLQSITIPHSVTDLLPQAFMACTGLTSVTIPSSITRFEANIFSNCSGLTSVTIEEGVPVIGSSAFAYCPNLTSVEIPNSVTQIYNNAFEYCSSLKQITIPESVTYLGSHAFNHCTNLSEITLGSGITEISSLAFSGCTSLSNITIPDGVTKIGEYAFWNCSSLKDIALPGGTKRIESGAFAGCDALTRVTIPDNVTYLGAGVFSGCESLVDITIGSGVTSIDSSTFNHCISLTTVEIPENVQSIGKEAFARCTSLEQITLPDGLSEIGDSAFFECAALQGIDLPEKLSYISNYCFRDCSSLRDIVLPIGVQAIGNGAFSGCAALETITFPGSLKVIYASAFQNCSSLKCVYYNGTEKQLKKLMMDPTGNDALLNAGLEVLCQHKWGKTVYTWSDDGLTLTATRTCKKDKRHIETETVDASYQIVEEAGCTTEGKAVVQSAEFENPAFEAQSKTMVIPAKGHEWGEAEFSWTEDLCCTARFTCQVCGTERECPAKVTCKITAEPERDKEGEAVCTAEAELDGVLSSETKTLSLSAGVCVTLSKTGKNPGLSIATTDSAYILPQFAAKQGWRVASWKSSKPAVASVSAEGKLTLKSAGKTTITVTATQEVLKGKKIQTKKISASIALTVVDPTIPTKIAIDQGNTTIYLGKPSVQLTVTAEPSETADSTATWKSAKTKIVKVAADGTLTPVNAGTAKITATSTKNKKAKATITVTVVDLTVPTGITIEAPSKELTVKGTLQLTPVLTGEDPEVEAKSAVTWKTKNKKIATVSKTGLVKGVKEGTVVITATTAIGKKVAEIELTVKPSTGAEETVELPDVEPMIEPAFEEPSDEQPAPEAEIPEMPEADLMNDWYGDDTVPEATDWYEEF